MMRMFAGLWAVPLLALATLASPAQAAPPMWVVKDANSEMVLFGSVHVLPPGLAWEPAALKAAIARADDLWFELPVTPQTEAETARLAAALGVLPPDKSLFALLPPADAARLRKLAQQFDVDVATLDRLEPWLAEVALAGGAYRKAGADTDHGVEQALSAEADPRVSRQALETPAGQLALFDSAPLADQIASLHETLGELEADPDSYMKLVDAWTAGDVGALDREALTPLRDASPELFRRLVTDRNAAWVKALDRRLKGKGRTVVVVGVGHLVGQGGLPARLRALGYSVTGP
jgi:uncharacterized protein YbaP (TraB family)